MRSKATASHSAAPGAGGAGRTWLSHSTSADLRQDSACLPELDVLKNMGVSGSFDGPAKALKLTLYLEENVTGHCLLDLRIKP